MNKEENNNHILIEVLNNDGDLKLTKFRNPQAIWQNNDYPDEYVFKDVDYINIFQLIQENKKLLELCMYALISSTKIYNHELANDTKQSFMKIIKDNIDLDTYSIREKIKKCWSDSNE